MALFGPRESAIFRHFFPCPIRAAASLGPRLRTASGAKGRRAGPCRQNSTYCKADGPSFGQRGDGRNGAPLSVVRCKMEPTD